MTCIVGLAAHGKVYIGGDSAGVGDWDLDVRKDPKVFVNRGFIMGFTSSFRMGQLLMHDFVPPAPSMVEDDMFRFMVKEFVPAVRRCFKDGGYASKTNEVEQGGVFLVGFRGNLFSIYEDYQVGEYYRGYGAVGCGKNFANGALHATQTSRKSPEARVRLALEAAEAHSAGVRAPFTIKSI